jgi:hypothetical protein
MKIINGFPHAAFDSQSGCVADKDYCSNSALTRWEGLAYGDVCRCKFCEEDLCNPMAVHRKPDRKTPKLPETTKTPKTPENSQEKPKSNSVEVEPPPQTEENKPNDEDGTGPSYSSIHN